MPESFVDWIINAFKTFIYKNTNTFLAIKLFSNLIIILPKLLTPSVQHGVKDPHLTEWYATGF